MKFKHLLLLGIMLTSVSSYSDLKQKDIPDELKPWIGWVLYNQDAHRCPHTYQDEKQRFCAWPSELSLDISTSKGNFDQRWMVYTNDWIRLPGNDEYWPHSVEVDSKTAIVVDKNKSPYVYLTKGMHRVSGSFSWEDIPKSISIPNTTGLLNLTLNGNRIDFPRINAAGELWLDQAQNLKEDEDLLEIQIYRKVIDDIPIRIESQILMSVAGQSRDIIIPRVLLQDFTPIGLNSELPARINLKGDIQVQVRPGNWTLMVSSYNSNNPETLSIPNKRNETDASIILPANLSSDTDENNSLNNNVIPTSKNHFNAIRLPTSEIWVFQTNPAIRLVDVKGVNAIDARMTRLPEKWQHFPAYQLNHDSKMTLKTLQRGGEKPEPNRLSLSRTAWLDFDGKGYTFQDYISGIMSRGWRLSTLPSIELGMINIDSKPQLITAIDRDSAGGIEVRRGRIELEADSRYHERISEIPVTGWLDSFNRVKLKLYLPPGWKLFSASGSENIPTTWMSSWTMLDLFFVLIIVFAVFRLWGWKCGIFTLLTLSLMWHEPGAPRYIILNIIAAFALINALPQGKIKRLVYWYRNLSFFVLFLLLIPFAIDQVRLGLHPQLTINQYAQDYDEYSTRQRISSVAKSKLGYTRKSIEQKEMVELEYSVDANASIQTGPGLPNWRFNPIIFNWNTPVAATQSLKLRLISPNMNFVLNILRITLLSILTGFLLMAAFKSNHKGNNKNLATNTSKDNTIKKKWYEKLFNISIMLLCFSMLYANSFNQVSADNISKIDETASIGQANSMPYPALLNELKARLLETKDCLPHCVMIESMRLQLEDEFLTIRLMIHSSASSAIPLPGRIDQWTPELVINNLKDATALMHDNEGVLWLGVDEGIQDVILKGSLPDRAKIQLTLPLIPKQAFWQGAGWAVEGIRENNRPTKQLQLVRDQIVDNQGEALNKDSVLPSLVHVERHLDLQLDWTMITTVTRLSPTGNPISKRIPLLEQESVISNTAEVKDKSIAIALDSTEISTSWRSRLPISDQINLTATMDQGVIESWKINISPTWHAGVNGIAPMHHSDSNVNWTPKWMPWPGESIVLDITRPKAIPGRTLTIQHSKLIGKIGNRSREYLLSLNLNSSHGEQHLINLPDNTELISVSHNNRLLPIRLKENRLSLPVTPGEQEFQINWRESVEISNKVTMPIIDLGVDSVNSNLEINLGRDRWVLYAGGPIMGPAVLFWGVLLVILAGAVILGRLKGSPLSILQWSLLGIGLSLVTPLQMLVVVGWFMLLQFRPILKFKYNPRMYNLIQQAIVILTCSVFFVLLFSLQQGLLGSPDMQIVGNSSHAWNLKWYQDRADLILPQPWVLSVPMLVYRVLMLLWALWLAISMINWLKWGWQNFVFDGIWKKTGKIKTTETGS